MIYFPHPFICTLNKTVELHLANDATRSYFKKAAGVDTPKFAEKDDLANFKSHVDDLDLDKLKNVADLCKLSNLVDNDGVKKTVYDN